MQNPPKFHYTVQERIECRKYLADKNYKDGMFDMEIGMMALAQSVGERHRENVPLLNPIAKRGLKAERWLERNKKLALVVLTMDVAVRHFFFA